MVLSADHTDIEEIKKSRKYITSSDIKMSFNQKRRDVLTSFHSLDSISVSNDNGRISIRGRDHRSIDILVKNAYEPHEYIGYFEDEEFKLVVDSISFIGELFRLLTKSDTSEESIVFSCGKPSKSVFKGLKDANCEYGINYLMFRFDLTGDKPLLNLKLATVEPLAICSTHEDLEKLLDQLEKECIEGNDQSVDTDETDNRGDMTEQLKKEIDEKKKNKK